MTTVNLSGTKNPKFADNSFLIASAKFPASIDPDSKKPESVKYIFNYETRLNYLQPELKAKDPIK